MWSHASLGGDNAFSAGQFWMLFLSVVFSWSNWAQCLLELIIFQQELINRTPLPIPPQSETPPSLMKTGLGVIGGGLPSNPTTYEMSPSLDEDWPLVWLVVVRFACLTISSSHITVQYLFFITIRFVLKTEHFHYLPLENCTERWSRFFFIYEELTHHSNWHNQGWLCVLSAWFGHAESCCSDLLWHTLIAQRLPWLAISINWCTWLCNTVQQGTAARTAETTLKSWISPNTFFIHCTDILCVLLKVFLPFLE